MVIDRFVSSFALAPMTNKRNNRRGRRVARAQSHLASGQQELVQLTTGTPSGTFVGGQIPLIPTFEPTSRLGVLALQYSQFEIVTSRVTYNSYTTTNTGGRVAMGFTYDTVDPDPVSCAQIIQIARSKNGVLWRNLTVSSPGRNSEKRRYAVISSQAFVDLDSQDKQIYTPASLFWGTDLSPSSGLFVGSLVWHYSIRFFNPNVLTGSVDGTAPNILTMVPRKDDDDD